MPTKPRNIPPALNLRPEVNLLTEFALIATSPQSPLVREVSGENADGRRREDDSPPPRLVDPKQMVGDRELGRDSEMSVSQFPFLITSFGTSFGTCFHIVARMKTIVVIAHSLVWFLRKVSFRGPL